MVKIPVRYIVHVRDDLPDGTWKHSRYELPAGTVIPRPEVGDAFYMPCRSCPYWDNCLGRHLYVIVPDPLWNGHWFNVDARAGNCGSPNERTHRCWVRHGDPAKGEPLQVDKNGNTCVAGAGSIQTHSWHGFVDRGFVTDRR
jgi:hypothetical protein